MAPIFERAVMMKLTTTIARILLGAIFCFAGAAGFFFANNPPPAPPGIAGQFQDIFFRSHMVLFVDVIELLSGWLLLLTRYVPLALTMLGAVIYNILVFHITMMPAGLPPALMVTAL